MAIYGNLMESYNNDETIISFTEAEIQQFKSDLLEAFMSIDEYDDIYEESSIEEGANIDMTNILKSHEKSIINNIKLAKKKLRKKEFSEANSILGKAKTELKQMETEIKKIESTSGSLFFGIIAGGFMIVGQLLIVTAANAVGIPNIKEAINDTKMFATTHQAYKYANVEGWKPDQEFVKYLATATVGMFTTTSIAVVTTLINQTIFTIQGIIKIVKAIKQFKKDIRENASDNNKFNLYRNQILTFCSDLQKSIDKVQKNIDKRSKMK